MVDYISETECFHMFTYFDKDEDGFLDFQEYVLVSPSKYLTATRPRVDWPR